jgi:hypothetical protein
MEDSVTDAHKTSGKLRKALAAVPELQERGGADDVDDVQLAAAKHESVGTLIRRFSGMES